MFGRTGETLGTPPEPTSRATHDGIVCGLGFVWMRQARGPRRLCLVSWAGLACLTLVTGLLSGSVWPVLVRGCWRWQVALSGIP